MIKKLLILAFLVPAVLFGQTESFEIHWDSTGSHGRFSFPYALYEDGDHSLPYYTVKLPWQAAGKLPRLRLEVTGSSPAEGISGYREGTGRVKDEPVLEYALVRERGNAFVQVKVLPFMVNGEGKPTRVNSFRIHMDQETPLARLKSETAGDWKASSVLASGNWFLVSVEKSGMHKLTYEQLQEIGLENPATVRVYGEGARLLPEKFSEGYTDDLRPVPVHMHTGGDGLFGPGDHILFYARGPVSWSYDEEDRMFVHRLHPYSREGYYFLTGDLGSPVSPLEAEVSGDPPTHTVEAYDHTDYLEEETYNLINSGREWYGDNFNVNLQNFYAFEIPGRIASEPVKVRVAAAARSSETSRFRISANSTYLGQMEIHATDLSTYTAIYAYETVSVFSTVPSLEHVTVGLEYDRPNTGSQGWLNALTIQARRALSMTGSQLPFRDRRSAGPGNVAEFRLENAGNGTVVWDVTDPAAALVVPHTLSGGSAVFRLETNQIREFVAFDPTGTFPSPEYGGGELGPVENQDLHSLQHPDLVILTPRIFLDAALELAEHRESRDGLETAVVLQQQVFNEFSSGTPDVTAIRNFMKMFYDRSGGSGESCRYLLLFGDGSYDNRNQTPENPNLILTYQSVNSLSPTRSYVSDDFFGLLDTDESMYNGLLDVGIGRLPASTPEEAEDLVRKIISYGDPANLGAWRNQLCFVGDDEDSNIHMRQADELATYVRGKYPGYNINKIYLDAYQQEKAATGFRYPEVTRAINDQMNRGALIINYTGHGGPQGLAHEQILTMSEINGWTNSSKLPLFMTATCEFSRYDEYDHRQDQEITSAGEKVLLNTGGGGIGLFTTTRLVYSGPNHVLNERFYEMVFETDEATGRHYRLGDIIAYSKNNTGAGVNKRNFTLLGDPSMRLVYPQHVVVTDSINGQSVTAFSDTLSAFDWVTVSGHVESQDGTVLENYNGFVYPVVFDKEKTIETLSNDDDPVWSFDARNSILYSGKATVGHGTFSFGFYVPKDINYAFGPGKISYYSNDSVVDAQGSFEAFQVGGIGSGNVTDLEPPVIDLYMNDSFFMPGGITDPDPILLAYVSDNYGINTTGNGIGHDLTATLDGDRINAIVLNEFYQANTNSYNSGIIRYPYSGLENGAHEITVKIWDIHNNSSESSLKFVVMDSREMLLEQLYNYPNPFVEQTRFNITHNRPDRELRLVLSIYTLSGELVRIIDTRTFSPGYRLEPVIWDGTSAGGDRLGGGVYLYRATLTTGDGERASDSGKLVIAR